jgi:CMP-N-acetylneuraminic acid synthetase
MVGKVNVFLPMRAGSQRIPKKNIRDFANIKGGLCKIKIEQLLSCDYVDCIYVSTDDPEVLEISKCFNSDRIKLSIRPRCLATSETSTDALIKHVPEIIFEGHVLWTHVTSPFVTPHIYDEMILKYFTYLGEFDSLMSVNKIQKFLWSDEGPINYDRKQEKWPRTQTINPLWEVNSAAFLASLEVYKRCEDRIGNSPYLFELPDEVAFDVDWPAEFRIAEIKYSSLQKLSQNNYLPSKDGDNKLRNDTVCSI